MKMTLAIQVLAGMDVQEFVVTVRPETLWISRGEFGGNRIEFIDDAGEPRAWFAHVIHSLKLEAS